MQPSPYATPGCIGATVSGGDSGAGRRGGGSGGAIWKEEEVSERQQYEYSDPRPQPEYVCIGLDRFLVEGWEGADITNNSVCKLTSCTLCNMILCV